MCVKLYFQLVSILFICEGDCCLTDRLDVEYMTLGDDNRVRKKQVPPVRVCGRKEKSSRRWSTMMCRMADGAAEPKAVNGRWETMKDFWLKIK